MLCQGILCEGERVQAKIGVFLGLPESPSGETEPDHPKPLIPPVLPSPDILISNTYHSVRGQLLAGRQRERQSGGWRGGELCPLMPLCPITPTGGDVGELQKRVRRPNRKRNECSLELKPLLLVCVFESVHVEETVSTHVCCVLEGGGVSLLLCKGNSQTYNLVRAKGGCLAPSPTPGRLTGH